MKTDLRTADVMSAWTTRGDGADQLQHVELPVPAPGHGELLIRVTALSLNYRDLLVVGGVGGWKPPAAVVPISGTGGVALFALQFAVALGARVVITSSSDDKLDRARALGAAHTVNYRTRNDLVEQILDWTGSDGVDHVIETIGGENLNHSLAAVKIGGTISFIGLIAGKAAQINTYEFVTKNVTLHGIETGSREMFEEMATFIDRHAIRPVIDSTFPRSRIRDALAHLQDGGQFGKIVIAG